MAALATVASSAESGRPGVAARAVDPSPGPPLTAPTGALDVDALLDSLAPHDAPSADRGAALVRFAEPVQRAALAALRASGARATAVLDALGSGQGELLPFVQRGETGPAAEAARAVATALEPSIVPLARNPDPAIRTKAIVLVARSSDDAAAEAVVAALEDSNEAVQRVALAAVGSPTVGGHVAPGDERALVALGKILAAHESWPMRVLAAGPSGASARPAPRARPPPRPGSPRRRRRTRTRWYGRPRSRRWRRSIRGRSHRGPAGCRDGPGAARA